MAPDEEVLLEEVLLYALVKVGAAHKIMTFRASVFAPHIMKGRAAVRAIIPIIAHGVYFRLGYNLGGIFHEVLK